LGQGASICVITGEVGTKGKRVQPSDAPHTTQPVVKIPSTLIDIFGLDSSHILVHSEYEEAEEVALLANTNNISAFLVGRQSGIDPPLSFLILIHKI
jgi:hypothetical protein